jgi:predicted phage gp36 major capsid-like protein
MTDQHRATPEQWETIERYADTSDPYSCILELRARIEALEAAQQPPQDKLDRLIALDADDGDPTDEELAKLVAWLRQFADATKGYMPGTTAATLALKVTRAAALLERLASDNAGLAAAADSLYADNMSLLGNHND